MKFTLTEPHIVIESNRTDCPFVKLEVSAESSPVVSRIPVELIWKNVVITTKSKNKERTIIHDVSGMVNPGQFLAIIGASGAGKTTLLNYLSGKMLARNLAVTGETLINGKSTKESKNYTEFTGFVQQEDVLMETLTVEECLEYAAKLKYSSDPEQRAQRLKEIMEELELNNIKNIRFGGLFQRNRILSKGERKRLSIAVELMTNPSLLFLDEPTTSMDTFTAEKIVNIICRLKNKGRTIIATIHQPNTDIYKQFDWLMIMSLGRVVYHVSLKCLV
jgi:ABC-type multidrug transport system ATPase subunit